MRMAMLVLRPRSLAERGLMERSVIHGRSGGKHYDPTLAEAFSFAREDQGNRISHASLTFLLFALCSLSSCCSLRHWRMGTRT